MPVHRNAAMILITCTACFLGSVLAGCAAEPDPEPTDSSAEAFVLGRMNQIFPGSGGTCEALAVVAAGGTAIAVNLTTATGGCAAGALVTTAGVGEPLCLVPAAGAALSGLAALLAGGLAELMCSSARAGAVSVPIDTSAQSRPGQLCDDRSVASRQAFVHSAGSCDGARRCDRGQSCQQLSERVANGARCLDARRKVQDCFDASSSAPAARASYVNHEQVIAEVKQTLVACRAMQKTLGCP